MVKFLIIMAGLGGGTLLGMLPRLYAPWGRLRTWILVVWIAISACATLVPPIATDLDTLQGLATMGPQEPINASFYITGAANDTTLKLTNDTSLSATASDRAVLRIRPTVGASGKEYKLTLPKDSELFEYAKDTNSEIIAKLSYSPAEKIFRFVSLESIDPWIVLPYVPGLGERMRIINFHVPVAWVAVLAYLFSMVYSIMYLRRRDPDLDAKAASAAALGTVFCILATVSGMIWAKFNWGAYWNWDPRETSIFMLLLIYAAYFTLRSAIATDDARARLSAVYNVLAAVTVPFFIFILPRITSGLHPGAAGEETTGPILSAQSEMMNIVKQITFALALGGFTALFLRLQNALHRTRRIGELINEAEDQDFQRITNKEGK